MSSEIFPRQSKCHLLLCVFILKIIYTLQKVRKVEKIIPGFILHIFISSMSFSYILVIMLSRTFILPFKL